MKITVRAFVVALVLTGIAATNHISASAQSSSSQITIAKTSAMPVPSCPPDDPNACGIARGN